MPVLSLADIKGYFVFDEEECRRVGMAQREAFQGGEPFPHLVLPDFLDPEILDCIAQNLPGAERAAMVENDHHRLKRTWHPQLSKCAITRNLFAELNGQAFLTFLGEATGQPYLIPDPYFDGAGLHEVLPGGILGIHEDRNMHAGMRVHRRINLLIYLNHGWQDIFGGHLELWDRSMERCIKAIAPTFGTAVIFATNPGSFHGHPDPLTCPPDRARKSLSQYYYSSPEMRPATGRPRPGALYVPRKGSSDPYDWRTRAKHLLVDLTPPVMYRGLLQIYNRTRAHQ